MKKERNYKIEGCFMDDEKKFAFIHIYKNASISMRNILDIRGKYHKWEDVKKEKPTTVAIIRHPLTRCISSFLYLLKLEDNGLPEQHPIEVTEGTKFFQNRDNILESFDQYLAYIQKQGFYDAVTLPQTEFLSDRGLLIDDVDEILIQGRSDSLKKEFAEFRDKYELSEDLKFPSDNGSNQEERELLLEAVFGKEKDQIKRRRKILKIYQEDWDLYKEVLIKKRWVI